PHYPFQGPHDKPLRTVGQPGEIQGARTDKKAAYKEMVEALDEGVGEIVSKLEELKLHENTMVWFMSDNGAARQGSNQPLRGYKGGVWEGGHRVPSIASWPSVIPSSTETSLLTMTCDVMPTLLSIAEVEWDGHPPSDGTNVTPWLTEPSRTPESLSERALFWNGTAMRQGPWKLIQTRATPAPRYQLFHLEQDLSETRNISDQYPDRVKSMRRALNAWKVAVEQSRASQPSDAAKKTSNN
ncbi:MAG: sulfatase-like hydrolase/transferase, partial [Planctomycetota bacterium]|nr:sulfatase-like hydrolase/transferase [Planctomycetota bacterium]